MSPLHFPPRNLGSAEPWGRAVEQQIREAVSRLGLAKSSAQSLTRAGAAENEIIASQIESLQRITAELSRTHDRVAGAVATGSWTESLAAGGWGLHQVAEPPPWASRGIVIAGMDSITHGSNAWTGRIEIVAAGRTITSSSLFGASNDVVVAHVEPGYSMVLSNPRIVQVTPSTSEATPDDPIYLRARGIRDSGGSTSTQYTFNAAFAVIWS